MGKLLNVEYACIHGTYWMMYGIICSFASVFLLGRGYNNSDIGIILAVGNVIAVFMQPLMADLADRSKKISLMGVTELASCAVALLTALLFVCKRATAALSVIFVLLVAWTVALQPLFNSMAFKLEESGYKMNFGVARSMGSLLYAVLCAFLGTLVEKEGILVLPISGEIVIAALLTAIWLVNRHFNAACRERAAGRVDERSLAQAEKKETVAEINLIDFARRNKLFMIVSLAIGCIFFSNAIFNSFMLQIVEGVGGNSEDMGRIYSLMAFLEIPPMFFFSTIHKRFSCQTLLKFASVCFTLKVACVYVAKSVFMIYVAHIFQLFSFAIFLPAIVSFIDEIMEKGEAVKGQALYTVVVTVSTVFASFVGGFILDVSGPTMLLLISLIITGGGAALLIALIGRIKGNVAS